jgi:LPS-assembly protein
VTLPNDLPNVNSNSDLLLTASGKFSGMLTANADLDYSESTHGVNEADLGLRLQPEPKKLLNIQYIRDVPNAIEQISTSGQWPVLSRWYGVGRIDYSLTTHDVTQGLIGIEYKADCWVLRLGVQHTQTATDVSSTSSFIQLELNGLGSLGQNAVESMRLNVPGYQAVNQAPRPINQY